MKKCIECGKKKKELVNGVCWKCKISSVGFGSIPGGARGQSASGGGVAVEGDQFTRLG